MRSCRCEGCLPISSGLSQSGVDSEAVISYVHERTMNACTAYVYAVARAYDRGNASRKDAAGAILYAGEKATQMALEAIQTRARVGVSSAFRQRVLDEESEHLPRGVGPPRIGVGAGGTAARPGMAGSVDDPLLEDRPPARIDMDRAAVGVPAGHPTVLHCCLHIRGHGVPRLRDDLIAVARVHRGLLIAMEHDRRDVAAVSLSTRGVAVSAHRHCAVPHGGERRREVARCTADEAGMDAGGGVAVGGGRPHDGGGRCTAPWAEHRDSSP